MLCFSKSAAAKQRMLNWFVPDVKMNRTYMQCNHTGYDLHPSPIKLLRKKGCWAKTAWGGKSVNSAISANCFPKVSKQEVAEHKTEWNLGKMCVFWRFGAKDRQFYTLLTQLQDYHQDSPQSKLPSVSSSICFFMIVWRSWEHNISNYCKIQVCLFSIFLETASIKWSGEIFGEYNS